MNSKGRILAVAGVALHLVFFLFLATSLAGLVQSLAGAGGSPEVQSQQMAAGIASSAGAIVAGVAAALLGMVLLLLALFSARYRAKWFLVAMWILSAWWLFSFPIGTAAGIAVMIQLVRRQDEFTAGF
jgi:hypothetical protein